MITYELIKPSLGDPWIRTTANGVTSCVPMSEDNTDYQAYLAWLAEGNQPEEAQP